MNYHSNINESVPDIAINYAKSVNIYILDILHRRLLMQKYYIIFVLTTIFCTSIFSQPQWDPREGSGSEKYHYFMTEGWLESDHAGSGFHLVDNYSKPNIWMRVFRYDTAVSQVVGLPNNETAGSSADWGDSLDSSNPPMRGGDYYKLLRTVDFDKELAEIQNDGKCSPSGRCYGDWINNELLWSVTVEDYKNKNGESFLGLRDDLQGQKRTRYRFDVFIEDNTPFWFKDKDGNYDLSKIPSSGLAKVIYCFLHLSLNIELISGVELSALMLTLFAKISSQNGIQLNHGEVQKFLLFSPQKVSHNLELTL